jgi:hypothetical protein
MLYKEIDADKLRLEFACPFCLSAKFICKQDLCDHVGRCQAALSFLSPAELADVMNLQIGGEDADADDSLTLSEYIADEEAYFKNMLYFAQEGCLSPLTDRSADELVETIMEYLKNTGSPTKNREAAAWRIMMSFFTLDDNTMERYLQMIYGESSASAGDADDSEDEERKVWPAPVAEAMPEVKTITIAPPISLQPQPQPQPEPSSTQDSRDSDS